VNKLYFRGTLGAGNFSPDRTTFGATTNAFGYNPVVWLETQVVAPLMRKSALMPYVFGGLGSLIADPLNGFKNESNVYGDKKPDRTVFSFPVLGAGLDFAVTPRISVFAEGEYRHHWYYFVKGLKHPFSTSFVSAGLRFGLPSRHVPIAVVEPDPIPKPQEIPTYRPPQIEVPVTPPSTGCRLSDLNAIYFNYDGDQLDSSAMSLLDENISELKNSTDCCVKVMGYTDEARSASEAMRIAERRARAVYDYYIQHGIEARRLQFMGMGIAQPNCNKSDPGKGCRFNRRVESKPMDCSKM
jgi:outer membrane protein OmpA-like peptidoglycan-associated protein